MKEKQRKLRRDQIEKLEHAMDYIYRVMMEIEETGKDKRIVSALDKSIGILYDIMWR